MVDIISLKLVAYGNTQKSASTGAFTCQHGAGECESDAIELCTQYKLAGDIGAIESGITSLAAWPFIVCMEEAEGVPSAAQGCFENTMNTTTVSWSEVEKCASDEYDLVQNAAMEATPAHDYVPWCLVAGVVLENSNLLQKAICDAYTGVKPPSCRSSPQEEELLPVVVDKSLLCYAKGN